MDVKKKLLTKMNPKRTVQQLRGTIGASAFELFVKRDLQWIYRPVHQENDFGIDGYIDVVESNEVTGAGLAVQIKCGNSYIAKRTEGGIRYDGEIKHLNYYCNHRQPILLIVLDENGENGYWVEFQLEKTLPADSPNKWWIEVPIENKLTAAVASKWKDIAGPTYDMTPAFEEEWKNYRFNDWCNSLIVAIRKNDVITCDTQPLFQWQSQLLKTRQMMHKKRASVEFWFEGWDDDCRELWDIPEIRAFYQKTFDDRFPWIYWLQPDFLWQGYQLLLSCGCEVSTKRTGDTVQIRPASRDAMKKWFDENFRSLNLFTDANQISLDINKECSDNLFRFLSTNVSNVEDDNIR
ncbi:DUF4365 domain-containing protein [Gimesia maris]|uniref:DUF4365 domain-containing protein n=1 Tax=Gimesia maris TaxID=122 RepID=UPI0032EB5C8C